MPRTARRRLFAEPLELGAKIVFTLLVIALLLLAFSFVATPAHAQTRVQLRDAANANTIGTVAHPVVTSCPDGTCAGGVAGAGYTAASAPFAVAAGVNKPAGVDTANSAVFTEQCKPGTTICADPTGPSGVYGVDGSTIATNANPLPTGPVGQAAGGMSTAHAIVANNTTSVAIDASPGTLYAVQVFNNSATIAYLKLYDAAQGSTTCGSGTPKKVILIPASTSGAGAVIPVGGGLGVKFATAITRCVTTGIADNDTGAPAASAYLVEADYK